MNRLQYTVVVRLPSINASDVDIIQQALSELEEIGEIVSVKAKSIRGPSKSITKRAPDYLPE